MRDSTLRQILMGLAVVLAAARGASGGGIEVPMQSGSAAGQADAFTAQADDPSAIFYNPAGLTQLKGTNVSAGAYFLFPEFHLDGASAGEVNRLPSVLPHIYAESDFGLDKFRFGIGVNDVFGINEDYGAGNRPLRFVVDKARLSVINIAPAVAYKVTDRFSLGLAFNAYYGNLELKRNALLGAPPFPEGKFRLEGDGWAFGVTPSFLWKINDQNAIGAYYRSPFTLDFDGNARVIVPVKGVPPIGPSPSHESLSFPQSVGFGYAYRPIPRLKLEADLIWTDWHSLDRLRLHSPDPHFNNVTLPANWKSGFTGRLGAQYNLTERWLVRGGYAYSQNSVPTSTFSPLVPDSNYHLFALGLGYTTPAWDFDLAYNFIYRETRHIQGSANSPAVDGTWENTIQGVMATVTFKF